MTLFFIIGICLTVVFAASGAFLIVSLLGDGEINFFEAHPFWFTYEITSQGEILNAVGIVLLFATGLAAFHFFRIFFKKNGQAEVFFFSLFLFSLIPEAFRMVTLALQIMGAPSLLGIILSRVVFAARVFGLFCLFFGSLYALDLQYQKFEVVVAAIIGFSLLLTFAIPFDSQLLLTNGLFKVSDEQGLFLIYYGLVLLFTVDYAISLVRGRNPLILLGILILLAGRELLMFTLSPVTLATGVAAVLAGIILSYKGFEVTYSLA